MTEQEMHNNTVIKAVRTLLNDVEAGNFDIGEFNLDIDYADPPVVNHLAPATTRVIGKKIVLHFKLPNRDE